MNPYIECGAAGQDSVSKQVFTVTFTSMLYVSKSKHSFAKPSSPAFDPQPGRLRGGLEAQVRSQYYLQGLCAKLQATWLRRFGVITNQAPCTANTAPTSTL
jgi:hypothetical protein